MDREYIRDAQVIERYLQGKLTADEEQAFEEFYLADAEVLEELQVAERLQQGFKELKGGGHVEPARGRARWLDLLASTRYATAASIVAAAALVSSGVLYLQNRDLRGDGGALQANVVATNTRLLPLLSVRGSNTNVVAAPADDEWTVLLLDAGFTAYDDYRAILYRRNGDNVEEVVRLENMTPTYEGLLALGLPGRQLRPGDYEVQLDGRTAGAFSALTRTALTVTAQ